MSNEGEVNLKRTFRKRNRVRIVLIEGEAARLIDAVLYSADEDGSECIVRIPGIEGYDLPRVIVIDPALEKTPISRLDLIDQPMALAPEDDPEGARVYSKIRAETVGEYEYYRCAHGSATLAEGTGIHFAAVPADVAACRNLLESKGLLYEWS